jgi:hypothetical protein
MDFRSRWSQRTVVRAANARIQLGSRCSRTGRPADPDRVVIQYLADL